MSVSNKTTYTILKKRFWIWNFDENIINIKWGCVLDQYFLMSKSNKNTYSMLNLECLKKINIIIRWHNTE